MMPDARTLFAVTEATWPPAGSRTLGAVTIREGQGGGKRVSAATVTRPITPDELAKAEAAMRGLGQTPLFQLHEGVDAFDTMLADAGYDVIDPVTIHVAPVDRLIAEKPPRVSTFTVWEPLAIMRDIWAEGGIGPERIAVMERVRGPKVGLFGRHADQPAAAGFVAVHAGMAMVHALEVRARHRRAGMGRLMMVQAALWAAEQGAGHLAALCVTANTGANALYGAMGFCAVGGYHYRVKE